MRAKRSAIIIGAVVLWAMSPVGAHAFEQQMPQETAPAAPVIKSIDPAVSLNEEMKPSEPEKKGRGFKLPGFGKFSIPKFNFGLDLMYGSPETSDVELGFSSEPAVEDDVTIMGKVKRRF